MSEDNKPENLPEGLCVICGKPVEITDGTDPDLSEVSHYLCEESAVIAHGGMSKEEIPEACREGRYTEAFQIQNAVSSSVIPSPAKRTTQIRPGLFLEVSGYDPENGRDTKDPYLGADGLKEPFTEGSHRITAGLLAKAQELALLEAPEAIELDHLIRQREEALKAARLILATVTNARNMIDVIHPDSLRAYLLLGEGIDTANALLILLGGAK